MFDNINVNLCKNEGFLTSIPCIPIPEYGQLNAPLICERITQKGVLGSPGFFRVGLYLSKIPGNMDGTANPWHRAAVVVRALASYRFELGLISRLRHYMWIEFVVSPLCSERFFSRYSGFPLS